MLTYSRVVFATIDAAKLIKKIFRAIIFPVAEFRYNVSDCGIIFPVAEFRYNVSDCEIIFPIAEFRTADAKKRQGAKNDRNNKR